MKQKIIIKISMHCSKCRARALKIAAVTEGVTSVALHGPEKDKLMIQGEDIDAACLTANLRKKLCHASLETIEEVKADKKEPTKPPTPIPYCCPQTHLEFYKVVSDPSPGLCPIL